MAEFLAMGGYAQFVWTAFGVSAIVLVANVIAANRSEQAVRRKLAMRLARQPRRKDET